MLILSALLHSPLSTFSSVTRNTCNGGARSWMLLKDAGNFRLWCVQYNGGTEAVVSSGSCKRSPKYVVAFHKPTTFATRNKSSFVTPALPFCKDYPYIIAHILRQRVRRVKVKAWYQSGFLDAKHRLLRPRHRGPSGTLRFPPPPPPPPRDLAEASTKTTTSITTLHFSPTIVTDVRIFLPLTVLGDLFPAFLPRSPVLLCFGTG